MRVHFSRFRTICAAVVTAVSLTGVINTGALAMGSSNSNSHRDIVVSGLNGFAAPGDKEALPSGAIRVYSAKDVKQAGSLPSSVQSQAALIAKLDKLQPAQGVHDVTAEAATLGVSPEAFDKAAYPESKRAKSNAILSVFDGGDSVAFFVARIAADQPDQAIPGVFHCKKASGKAVRYQMTYLENARPKILIQIKDQICEK